MTDLTDPGLPEPFTPRASAAHAIQAALAAISHPANLDLHDRLRAIETALRVLTLAVIPLLPAE